MNSLRLLIVATALLLPQIAASGQERSVYHGDVARVRVDVVATDGEGHFVADLRADEFRVFEDGIPQEILSSQVVDLVSESTHAGSPGGPPRATASAGAGNKAGEAVPESSPGAEARSDLAAIVYLLDFAGLDWKSKTRFVEAWQLSYAESEPPPVPTAAYMIDQLGYVRELTPLTQDPARLWNAAEVARQAPLVRTSAHERLVSGADAGYSDSDAQRLARSRATLELLTSFCESLSARSGRKAVVWVSSEVQITEGGPDAAVTAARLEKRRLQAGSRSGSARELSSLFRHVTPDAQVMRLQEQLREAANSANVSIYSVDPAPVAERIAIGNDTRVRSSDYAAILSGSTVQGALDGLRDAQRDASATTGGKSYIGATDLDAVLADIASDSGQFYLLTYSPPPPNGDGDYHHIEVQVLRKGVVLRWREGYVDFPADERHARTIEAALALPGTVAELPVATQAYRRWSTDGEPLVQSAISVESPAADPGTDAERQSIDALAVYGVAVTSRGRVADEFRQEVRFPSRPRSGDALRDREPLIYVHDWQLEPGDYQIRIVAEEIASGRLGGSLSEVGVPEPSQGWQTSDLILLAGKDETAMRPLVGPVVAADSIMHVYVQVLSGVEPTLSGEIFAFDGRSSVARFPRVTLSPAGVGLHEGVIRFHGLSPGEFTLQFMVVDQPAQHHEVFRERLQVLPHR
jgi:VWFA-related protein